MCFEFRTDYAPFDKAQEVIYVKSFAEITIKNIFEEMTYQVSHAQLMTKYERWSYENEWRVILLDQK
jgi:hypothetical protein